MTRAPTLPCASRAPTLALHGLGAGVRRWIGLAAVVLALMACSGDGKRRAHGIVFPRQMAAGRPATCPDDVVDPDPGLMPGPMDARCSFDDALGGPVVHVHGKVLLEGEGLLPGAAREARVVLRSAESHHRAIVDVLTDAQGGFSFVVVLRERSYVIEALDRESGKSLAVQPLVPARDLAAITIIVPAR